MNNVQQIKMIANQAKQMRNRYRQSQVPFTETDTTCFYPIRHFNSDTPVTPGCWQNIPYRIAERPYKIQQDGVVPMEPILIGGGYFLWHRGYGLAIDPGYGFVHALFYYHGITVRAITHVIVTHDHLDHHADMETIILFKQKHEELLHIHSPASIQNAYNLESRFQTGRSKITNTLLQPEESFDVHWTGKGISFSEPKKIKENTKDLDKSIIATINTLPCLHSQRFLGQNIPKSSGDQTLIGHGHNSQEIQRKSCKDILTDHFLSFGLHLELYGADTTGNSKELKRNILITSDTLFPTIKDEQVEVYSSETKDNPYFNPKKAEFLGWSPRKLQKENSTNGAIVEVINEQAKKMVSSYKQLSDKCDIVCLHLGSVKGVGGLPDDTPLDTNFLHNPAYCYPGFHLGITGCTRVLELLVKKNKFDTNEGLVIVTEFGEELLGHRKNICDVIAGIMAGIVPGASEETAESCRNGRGLQILPSEVTLKIALPFTQEGKAGHVYCNFRREANSWRDAVALEGPGEIITYTLFDELGKASPRCTAI